MNLQHANKIGVSQRVDRVLPFERQTIEARACPPCQRHNKIKGLVQSGFWNENYRPRPFLRLIVMSR